jgi:hypothetical protein
MAVFIIRKPVTIMSHKYPAPNFVKIIAVYPQQLAIQTNLSTGKAVPVADRAKLVAEVEKLVLEHGLRGYIDERQQFNPA